MQITNPATEEIICELKEDSVETLDEKFQKLCSAQPLWYREPLVKRIEVRSHPYLKKILNTWRVCLLQKLASRCNSHGTK